MIERFKIKIKRINCREGVFEMNNRKVKEDERKKESNN